MKDRLQIAIADDDRLNREFLVWMVRRLGHEVVCLAEDGRQLVDYCLESPPDLVITDVSMPHVDGVSAAAAINWQHDVPIVLLSGMDLPDPIEQLQHVNVLLQRMKPITSRDLEDVLTEAMRMSAAFASAT